MATSYTLPLPNSTSGRRSSADGPGPSLALPSFSLGSLMDVDYFDSIGRTPAEMETKQKSQLQTQPQSQQPLSSSPAQDPHSSPSFYSSTVQAAQMPTSPSDLDRQRSLSSERRVWKPRPDSQSLSGGKQPNTPPTQDLAIEPDSLPESSSPPVSPSQRPVSYLPPGAASPHHYRQGSASYVPSPPAATVSTPSSGAVGITVASRSSTLSGSPPNPRQGSSSGPPASFQISSSSSALPTPSSSSTQPQGLPPGAAPSSIISRRDAPSMYTAPSSPPPTDPLPPPPAPMTLVDRDLTSSPAREPSPRDPSPAHQKPPIPTSVQPQIRMSSSPKPLNQTGPYPSFPGPSLVPPSRPGPGRPVVVEEVCIECMMRDRDMADVDVSGNRVWERESDVWYEELVRREKEEEGRGRSEPVSSNGKTRPKARGGKLTEDNIKVWLTMVRLRVFFERSLLTNTSDNAEPKGASSPMADPRSVHQIPNRAPPSRSYCTYASSTRVPTDGQPAQGKLLRHPSIRV